MAEEILLTRDGNASASGVNPRDGLPLFYLPALSALAAGPLRRQRLSITEPDFQPVYEEGNLLFDPTVPREISFPTEADKRAAAVRVLRALRNGYGAADGEGLTHRHATLRRAPELEGDFPGLPVVLLKRWELQAVFREPHDYDPWHERETGTAAFVPAREARAYLWRHYGLNLGALAAFQRCANPHTPLFTEATSRAAYAYFGRPTGYAPAAFSVVRNVRADGCGLSEGTEAADYYLLNDFALLVGHLHTGGLAFMRGRDAEKLSPERPPLACGITFNPPPADAGAVYYFDSPDLAPQPEQGIRLPGGLKGTALEKLQKLYRLRADMHARDTAMSELALKHLENSRERDRLRNQIRLLQREAKETPAGTRPGGTTAAVRDYTKNLTALEKKHSEHMTAAEKLIEERQELEARNREQAEECAGLYVYLVGVLAKKREPVLANIRAHGEVSAKLKEARRAAQSDAYTRLASNIHEALPHMSVLPAGVNATIARPGEGLIAEAVARLEREVRGGARAQLEFALEAHGGIVPDLLRVANVFFGHRMNWIFPLGYVGLAKIYQQENAYTLGEDLATTASDFWCTVRPGEADRIRSKGLEDWWKSRQSRAGEIQATAKEAFLMFHAFMARVTLPYELPRGRKEIYGLTQLASAEEVRRGDKVVNVLAKWRFNPALEDFITGGGDIGEPLFMVVDSKAMFSYSGKQLYLAPALQIYLELMVRQNVYKGLEGHGGSLLTPQGDGITYGTLAERLGLPNAAKPSDNVRRINAALETVAEAGIVADFKPQGAKRADPYETKLDIRVGEQYGKVYAIAKLEREEARLARQLATPFAPTKRGPDEHAYEK